MARKQKTNLDTLPVVEETTIDTTPVVQPEVETKEQEQDMQPQVENDPEEQAAIAEIDHQIGLSNSKVKPHYKRLYKERARAQGIKGKAAKRSTWDWLAQRMAELTLTSKAKLKLEEFGALMAANDIDIRKWTHDEEGNPKMTPGWEGRLRMTGGLVLRRKLAETGVLHLADGTTEQMPEADFEALRAKFSL